MTNELSDTTAVRMEQLEAVNAKPGSREALAAEHGQVWNTSELQRDFVVLSFLAPYAVVQRKSDGKRGTLVFQHNPRFYFNFSPDEG